MNTVAQKTKPLIRFENVCKSFDGKVILDGFSFEIYPGETFLIIGGSGTGKSVTLKLLMGLIPIDSGEIYFEDMSITKMSEAELNEVRRKAGVLFQGGALFDSMTVYENVAYPLDEMRQFSESEIEEKVLTTLGLVGLEEAAELYPASLSGGMVKRVALARAIVHAPRAVLYDEPTAGLDPTNTNRIDDLILDLTRKLKMTSIVVTHHMPSIERIADRVAFLYDRRTHFYGTFAELRASKDEILRQFISGTLEVK